MGGQQEFQQAVQELQSCLYKAKSVVQQLGICIGNQVEMGASGADICSSATRPKTCMVQEVEFQKNVYASRLVVVGSWRRSTSQTIMFAQCGGSRFAPLDVFSSRHLAACCNEAQM